MHLLAAYEIEMTKIRERICHVFASWIREQR